MSITSDSSFKNVPISVCFLLMLAAANQPLTEIKVPNYFTSGAPAKASDVNENFAALVEDIQAIVEPVKKYSRISSETLESGLVRTKLYAFDALTYETLFRYEDKIASEGTLDLTSNLAGQEVNAFGAF